LYPEMSKLVSFFTNINPLGSLQRGLGISFVTQSLKLATR